VNRQSITVMVVGLVVGFLLTAAPANAQSQEANTAFQNGLWACNSPLGAMYLDEDIVSTKEKLKLNYSILDQLSGHHGCRRIDSDNLKPVSFNGPDATVLVSDGKQTGWTGILSYVTYMHFHVVQK
jgi:hypothetical protein